MRFLFLSILLCNIVFFFWEYRKGAPEIYLPISSENKVSNDNPSQIFLLSELPVKVSSFLGGAAGNSEVNLPEIHSEKLLIGPKQTLIANDDFIEPLNNIEQVNTRVADLNLEFIGPLLPSENTADNSEVLKTAKQEAVIIEPDRLLRASAKAKVSFACYLLQDGEYSERMFATSNKSETFKFELVRQEQQHISSYLVLTLAANSYQEAKTWEKSIKQQGINELWLFTRGKFKWRISLGLFSTQSKAEKVKASFTRRISRELEVVPSYQTKVQTEIKISGLEKDISLFKDEFFQCFKQESECAKVQDENF